MKMRFLKQIFAVALGCAAIAYCVPGFSQDAPQPDQAGGGRMGGAMGGSRGVRGTVTEVAGNQVTIKTDEGDIYKVTTGENTHLMKDRQPAALTDIHVGDMLMVGGQVDSNAKTVGAAFVAIVDAEQVRKMRAELGKTWIAGKITAVEGTKITVERMDGVSQTIAVDENTSFHKHRDAITLADFKVGDPISGRGALKDGVFVAAQVNYGAMGMGRGPGGPGGPGEMRGRDTSGQGAPGTSDTPK